MMEGNDVVYFPLCSLYRSATGAAPPPVEMTHYVSSMTTFAAFPSATNWISPPMEPWPQYYDNRYEQPCFVVDQVPTEMPVHVAAPPPFHIGMQIPPPMQLPLQFPVSVHVARQMPAPVPMSVLLPPNAAFIEPNVYSVNVPRHLQAMVFGPNWGHAKDIKEKHHVDIHVPNSQVSTDQVYVLGDYEHAIAYINHLNEMVQVLSVHIYSMTIPVEPKHYMKIIGHRRSNLYKIMTRHWVNVIIPSKEEREFRDVVVWGLKAHCLAACDDIYHQIQNSNLSQSDKEDQSPEQAEECQQSSTSSINLSLDSKIMNIIKRHPFDVAWMIRNKFAVQMVVAKNQVLLQGPLADVEQAQDYLQGMSQVEQQVAVPRKQRSFIVGKSGRSIRAMSLEHNVLIHVPTKKDNSDTVVVFGSHQSNIDEACKALMDLAEKRRMSHVQIK